VDQLLCKEEESNMHNNKKATEIKYLRIEKADYVGKLTVMLTFNDGAVVTIDFGSWIAAHPHPQHNRYS
jgi:hypothetical protein